MFFEKLNYDSSLVASILEAAQSTHGLIYPKADWFNWKFFCNPYGESYSRVALSESGEVAGFLSFSPQMVCCQKNKFRSCLSFETFVVSSFQKRGVFSKLCNLAMQDALSDGVQLMFNFPNPKSAPGFIKMGWKSVGGLNMWIKPINKFKFISRLVINKGNLGPFMQKNIIFNNDEFSFNDYVKSSLPYIDDGKFKTDKNYEYLKWRFLDNPIWKYNYYNSGYFLFIFKQGIRQELSEIQIMDIISLGDGNYVKFCEGLSVISDFFRPDVITMLATEGFYLQYELRKYGFFKKRSSGNFFVFSGILSDVFDRNVWSLTTADCHTY